jgi:hypothetical protein
VGESVAVFAVVCAGATVSVGELWVVVGLILGVQVGGGLFILTRTSMPYSSTEHVMQVANVTNMSLPIPNFLTALFRFVPSRL